MAMFWGILKEFIYVYLTKVVPRGSVHKIKYFYINECIVLSSDMGWIVVWVHPATTRILTTCPWAALRWHNCWLRWHSQIHSHQRRRQVRTHLSLLPCWIFWHHYAMSMLGAQPPLACRTLSHCHFRQWIRVCFGQCGPYLTDWLYLQVFGISMG